jgi:hypothetical protein
MFKTTVKHFSYKIPEAEWQKQNKNRRKAKAVPFSRGISHIISKLSEAA